jgi:hypothetical protein
MQREHATASQRIGIFLAFIEALVLGLLAVLHFGVEFDLGNYTFATAFLYPAGIVEGIVALALLLAVVLPANGTVRSGRVLGAQILTVIGLFVVQVGLMRAPQLFDLRMALVYASALVLALASMALIAAPAMSHRSVAR